MKKLLITILLVAGINLFAKDGIVKDSKNHLQWQDNVEHSELIWKLSKGYCSQLNLGGFHDWRMPDREELIGLAKNKKLKRLFVNLEDALYWTRSEDKDDNLFAYTIYSGNGHDSISDKCDKYFVLCVRTAK
ncbi:MAG TPA: DUF1566 domain-containing protein [Sulfurimonas autotrophica]|uniref:DUF1566 domain-containing protein n=1 Tax=Sulfurimonas autotrophica TaxID=202747 RepID=A0A7C3C232_9BACT|nr:DUF1566 domain-containing protein [Sulfurimonas autotrophica]